LKAVIKFLLNPFFGGWIKRRGERKQISDWVNTGRPIPPIHVYKQYVIKKIQKEFKVSLLVETGTFQGQMIDAVLNSFSQIHSIELHPVLYENALKKFSQIRNVKIWQGDSAIVLKDILLKINTPCLFWLDGHYSGEGTAMGDNASPVVEELKSIASHSLSGKHVILIDDANCFNGEQGCPTLNQLREMVTVYFAEHTCKLEDNIVHILPPI
jgi:hypothetical protein